MDIKPGLIFCGLLVVTTAFDNVFDTETGNTYKADNDVVKTMQHIETSKALGDLLGRIENLEAREKSREKTFLYEIQNLKRKLLIQTRRTAYLEHQVRRFSNRNPHHFNQNMDKMNTTDFEETSNDRNGRIKSASMPSREDVQIQRIRRTENENPVAFFATLSHHLTHVGAHQPITFNNVVTNIGNAYNSHFGSFIAPVSGTYVFSTTLYSHYHSNYHAQFVKNGLAITSMYMTGQESGYGTTSQTIVLELLKGDDVCVQNLDTDKPVYGYNYSTFAGFLLQEDISSSAIVGK